MTRIWVHHPHDVNFNCPLASSCLYFAMWIDYGSFIGSHFITIICFYHLPMIFNRLSWFEAQALMFGICPFLVGLLDHEILDNYWIDEISFRTIPLCLSLALYNPGVSLTSFFPKQNVNLWPWAKEIPLEPSTLQPSLSLDCLLLVGLW